MRRNPSCRGERRRCVFVEVAVESNVATESGFGGKQKKKRRREMDGEDGEKIYLCD